MSLAFAEKMKPTIYLFFATFSALCVSVQGALGNGCDLPSPAHPSPIQTLELTEGMIFRYPYSSFIEVAEVGDISGSGRSISFKATQAGSFKIR